MKEIEYKDEDIEATIRIKTDLSKEEVEKSVSILLKHLSSELKLHKIPELRKEILELRERFLRETVKCISRHYQKIGLQVPKEVIQFLNSEESCREWIE